MEQIISRIKAWCETKNLSPAELAKELGMNRSTVVHMLNGRNKPNLVFIVKLAEYDEELDLRNLLTGRIAAELKPPQKKIEFKPSPTPPQREVVSVQTVEKLVVLNVDGTYKTYLEE